MGWTRSKVSLLPCPVARRHNPRYAEGLPGTGSAVCAAGDYARKHAPWVNFTTVPAAASMPMTAFPAGNYAALPTVSFVVPFMS